jgi:hypothetical protein
MAILFQISFVLIGYFLPEIFKFLWMETLLLLLLYISQHYVGALLVGFSKYNRVRTCLVDATVPVLQESKRIPQKIPVCG